jgi:O-antigen ligase
MQYVTPDFSAYGGEWLYTVHNKYLLVWAQTGLGGLITFIAVLIVALINGWRAWRLQDRFLSPLALGLGAGLVGHMVHMWVDVFAARPQIQTLWICSALLAGLAQVAQSAAREHTSFEAARVGSFQWRRYAHS